MHILVECTENAYREKSVLLISFIVPHGPLENNDEDKVS